MHDTVCQLYLISLMPCFWFTYKSIKANTAYDVNRFADIAIMLGCVPTIHLFLYVMKVG